jgi:hypothetical protein
MTFSFLAYTVHLGIPVKQIVGLLAVLPNQEDGETRLLNVPRD